ncbi:MAG TPA: DPP IV N-terminal domain-containing protein, partial [Gemmatimonadaceae bacterium]|nr:DPP IV N-terminal domain-containing protein [Gemmatimonadaceae bacterium]
MLRSRYAARVVSLGLGLVIAGAPRLAVAQEKASDTLLTVQHYLDYETVSSPQISPDGSQIIYTRRWVDKLNDRWETALWVMSADGSRNRFLVKGGNAIWSPDGTRIAYIAEAEQPKGAQIFVRWMDAEGASTQVTRLTEGPSAIKWSPDGKYIGFASFVAKPPQWKIDMPAPPENAKWTKSPRLIERLHFRQDRRGFTEPGFTHLFVVPADGGTPRQITSGDWNVGFRFDGIGGNVGWDWTPDGKTIVVEGLDEADADLRYRDSHLYAVDVATTTRRRLTSAPGTWTNPVISKDGRRIAFTGYPQTKQTYKANDLYVMNIDGSGMKAISGNLDRDPQELKWAADNSGVYFTAENHGSNNIQFAGVNGGVRAVTTGVHMLSLGSVADNGVAAGVRSSFHAPSDIVRLDLKRPQQIAQLTRVNEDMLGKIKLGEVEEVWYTSSGNARVQGWIVKPPSFDRTKKYPLILEIHGGPHGMYNVAFNYMFQNFAANGYLLLYTNPRGSTGY